MLSDLLAGRRLPHAQGRGTVDMHVDLNTLAGLADHPGDLGGYGPVVADIARQTADQQRKALWRWYATDPDTGEIVAHGTIRRRPTAAAKRRVQFRHRRCVYAGCRMPATESDLDHTIPWSRGGATHPHNLKPLCRHHHPSDTWAGSTRSRTIERASGPAPSATPTSSTPTTKDGHPPTPDGAAAAAPG